MIGTQEGTIILPTTYMGTWSHREGSHRGSGRAASGVVVRSVLLLRCLELLGFTS